MTEYLKSLSDKMEKWFQPIHQETKDIREFISKLKEVFRERGVEAQRSEGDDLSLGYRYAIRDSLQDIDKLAGEKLIHSQVSCNKGGEIHSRPDNHNPLKENGSSVAAGNEGSSPQEKVSKDSAFRPEDNHASCGCGKCGHEEELHRNIFDNTIPANCHHRNPKGNYDCDCKKFKACRDCDQVGLKEDRK